MLTSALCYRTSGQNKLHLLLLGRKTPEWSPHQAPQRSERSLARLLDEECIVSLGMYAGCDIWPNIILDVPVKVCFR